MTGMFRWLMCAALVACVFAPQQVEAKAKPQPNPIMESDQPGAKNKAKRLPALEDGPGKGFYVYHKGRHFEAVVDTSGSLHMWLLDDKDKRLSEKPWRVLGGVNTSWSKLVGYNPKNNRPIVKHFVRYIKEFKEISDPTDRPRKEIEIKVTLMDDVYYVRRYRFDRDQVSVWSGYDCENEGYKSRYRVGIAFPKCMSFARNVEQPEREKQLDGYELEVRGRSAKKKRDKQTIPYAKSENFYVNPVEKLRATGPWGPRTVRVETDDPIMRVYKYNGRCPYEGFGLRYDVGNETHKYTKQVEFKIMVD